jgi:hypothetical protein
MRFSALKKYILLPLLILKFWYIESVITLLGFFFSFNSAFLQLFSLPLFLKTYFKPLKNEYRQGLVGFSIAMGIVIKTFFIIADLLIFSVILLTEVSILFAYLAFPIISCTLLFIK